jgi:hypothetical protein
MICFDMARLLQKFEFSRTGGAGAAVRALASRSYLAPGTLAFLPPAR